MYEGQKIVERADIGGEAKFRGEAGPSSILRRLLTFLYGKMYPSKGIDFFLPNLARKLIQSLACDRVLTEYMANTGESDHQYIKLTSLAQRFGVWEVMEGSLYIWNKQHKKVKCIPFFIPFQGTTTDKDN